MFKKKAASGRYGRRAHRKIAAPVVSGRRTAGLLARRCRRQGFYPARITPVIRSKMAPIYGVFKSCDTVTVRGRTQACCWWRRPANRTLLLLARGRRARRGRRREGNNGSKEARELVRMAAQHRSGSRKLRERQGRGQDELGWPKQEDQREEGVEAERIAGRSLRQWRKTEDVTEHVPGRRRGRRKRVWGTKENMADPSTGATGSRPYTLKTPRGKPSCTRATKMDRRRPI